MDKPYVTYVGCDEVQFEFKVLYLNSKDGVPDHKKFTSFINDDYLDYVKRLVKAFGYEKAIILDKTGEEVATIENGSVAA